tara:strand:+ start:28969 stop:29454 length:486 start_codon:yes stop_codon:yes gene_type:complete
MMRVGQGFDVHAFEPGSGVVLGGVHIPFDKALKAHSDGDVLIHALCDALLGAVALGDIGRHFPDSDPRYRGISSVELLQAVMRLLAARQWSFVNADMTVIAEAPKIAPHVPAMVNRLAAAIPCQPEQLNIKATTSEGLGFTGRGEGIACQAVVLIQPLVSA